MNRFPRRTLILMILALIAFVWMWWATHHRRAEPRQPLPVEVVPSERTKPPR